VAAAAGRAELIALFLQQLKEISLHPHHITQF
jgi:hypothetical protein